MGTIHVADALTGLSIVGGEPVVAALVDRRRFGWPDPRTDGNFPAFRSTGLFEPVALPIRGAYDGYGRVDPDPGQAAVALACAMTGHADWESFAAAAFDRKGGVRYEGHGPAAQVLGDGEHDEPVALGTAFFRPASWERLVALGRGRLTREADVAAVMSAMADIRGRAAAGDRKASIQHCGVLDLTQRHPYVTADGGSVRLPRLACALDYFEGGSEVSRGFAEWLSGKGGRLGFSLLDGDALDGVRPILEGLHDLQAMSEGLRKAGRVLLPSPSTSQDLNHESATEMAFGALVDAAGCLMANFDDEPHDAHLDDLEALAARAEAIREALAARIEAARQAPPAP